MELRQQIVLALIDGGVKYEELLDVGPEMWMLIGLSDRLDALRMLRDLWPDWTYSTRGCDWGCLIIVAVGFMDQIRFMLNDAGVPWSSIEEHGPNTYLVQSDRWGSALSVLRANRSHWVVDPYDHARIVVKCKGMVIGS